MNQRYVNRMIWITLVGAAFFAFRLPSILYGRPAETIDVTIQPRFTFTAIPPEALLTQQAFALMFFTPTQTAEPTRQPFLAFLLPITGSTRTFTPTASITNVATLSATPTRTLLPVFQTQTRVNEGGGGSGGGNTFTATPFRTSTPNVTVTVLSTSTTMPTATDVPSSPTAELPTDTDTPIPDSPTPRPPNTHRPPTDVPPTATDVPPTDIPTDPPDTPVPSPEPGGNSLPGNSSTSSGYLMRFILMYVFGAAFLGVVFRRR